MGKPVFLVENVLSEIAFPSHVLTANEEASGGEVFRLADYRRRGYGFSRWTSTTPNQAASVKIDMAAARPVDTLVLDVGNLKGETVTLEESDDDAIWSQVFQEVVPSSVGTDVALTAGGGVLTPDDFWIRTFASPDARYLRLTVSAMGAGLKPEIYYGILGKRWAPGEFPGRPHDPDEVELTWEERRAPGGGVGVGTVTNPRTGIVRLKLPSFDAYDDAKTYFRDHWIHRRPALYVPDDEAAEGAFLIVPPQGRFKFEFPAGTEWAYRAVELAYEEHEPQ